MNRSVTGTLICLIIFISLLWIAVGGVLAFSMPNLWNTPPAQMKFLEWGPPGITVFLLLVVLVVGIRRLQQTGKVTTALPLSVVLFGLFALLFLQIAFHLGTSHYQWNETPGWKDGTTFLGMHAFRAGDVADGLEAFGFHTHDLSVQPLYARSHLACGTLIVYHLVSSLFFLSLLVAGWQRLWKRKTESTGESFRKKVGWLGLIIVAGGWALLAFTSVNPWTSRDRWIWWVDNLVRVIDFTDTTEIFHLRLHQLPFTWQLGTLTFACRLVLLLLIGELIQSPLRKFSIYNFRGLGVSSHSLQLMARDETNAPRLRENALTCLHRREQEQARVENRWLWRSVFAGTSAAMILVGIVWWRFPHWYDREAQSRILAKAATGNDLVEAARAEKALEILGSFGGTAAREIILDYSILPLERRLRMIDLLGGMGKAGTKELGNVINLHNRYSRQEVIQAARRVNPVGATGLTGGRIITRKSSGRFTKR